MKDAYTQEELKVSDSYPAILAQGSLLKATFKRITDTNDEQEYVEVLYLVKIDETNLLLVSFSTGNRWFTEKIPTDKDCSYGVRGIELFKYLAKTPNAQLVNLEYLGHSGSIDVFDLF